MEGDKQHHPKERGKGSTTNRGLCCTTFGLVLWTLLVTDLEPKFASCQKLVSPQEQQLLDASTRPPQSQVIEAN